MEKNTRLWIVRSGNWRQWRKFEWNEWWTGGSVYLFFRFSFFSSSFLWYCCRRKWEIWFDSNSYTIHPNSPVYTSFTFFDSWHSSCSITSIYTMPCYNVHYIVAIASCQRIASGGTLRFDDIMNNTNEMTKINIFWRERSVYNCLNIMFFSFLFVSFDLQRSARILIIMCIPLISQWNKEEQTK